MKTRDTIIETTIRLLKEQGTLEAMALFTEEIWLVTLFRLNYLEVGGKRSMMRRSGGGSTCCGT